MHSIISHEGQLLSGPHGVFCNPRSTSPSHIRMVISGAVGMAWPLDFWPIIIERAYKIALSNTQQSSEPACQLASVYEADVTSAYSYVEYCSEHIIVQM